MAFWSKPKPPKPLEEMTEEELTAWKKQNHRALIILGIGCVLAALVILQGVFGVLQANRERDRLLNVTALESVSISATGTEGRTAAIPQELRGRGVFGEKLKLRQDVIPHLRVVLYAGVSAPEGGNFFNRTGSGQVLLWQVDDPAVLTDTERTQAVQWEGEWYFAAIRGEKLDQEYYAVTDAALITWLLEQQG